MASQPAAKSLQVLLPTLGSAGDVHPFIALGLALRARGHRPTLITNGFFRDIIERQGLGFCAVGSVEDAEAAIADPSLWHPRKGFKVLAQRLIVPAIASIYRAIETRADENTVVAASSISLGARVAQERLGIPTATIHLQPAVIRSLIDQGMVGNLRISASQPLWFKRALFRLIDWVAIDRQIKRPLNEFRASLGLAAVDRVLHRWIHSPDCVIGFFPEWFARPQTDWPPHTHLVGFPLWDGNAVIPLPPGLDDFLDAGDPPVIFTPGSAAATMQRFFLHSVEAVRRIGVRAMLVTNYPEQLPQHLPERVKSFGYLPFSAVLPRAAMLIHHGGVGTLAQAVKAGIPHLVVPSGYDQFDNGWRIEQLGLGRCIAQSRYDANGAAEAIRAILDDAGLRLRARAFSGRMDNDALDRACTLLEGLSERASSAANSKG